MKALDLCCGAGGWSLGAKLAGWEVEGIDLDMDAVATYQANVGPAAVADVRQVHGHPNGIRVVIGGVPCQPYSIAGKREGEDAEDGRLWLEWLRIAVELDAAAIALENVRGFATWNGGRFIREVIGTIERKGFLTAWQVLDAADYGVPQHRDRVFLVGFRDPEARARFRWPEPTHGPPGHLWLPRYRTVRDALGIPLDEPAKTVTTGGVDHGGSAEPFRDVPFRDRDTGRDPMRASRRPIAELRAALLTAGLLDRPSTTIAADPRVAPAGHHEHVREGAVRLGPAELALLQGFPPEFRFHGTKTSQYRQIGNAVPPGLGAAVCSAIARALGT
jgi:DNA (cytosine-5)-methyltransferase 1